MPLRHRNDYGHQVKGQASFKDFQDEGFPWHREGGLIGKRLF
jgi:hypothetical protein